MASARTCSLVPPLKRVANQWYVPTATRNWKLTICYLLTYLFYNEESYDDYRAARAQYQAANYGLNFLPPANIRHIRVWNDQHANKASPLTCTATGMRMWDAAPEQAHSYVPSFPHAYTQICACDRMCINVSYSAHLSRVIQGSLWCAPCHVPQHHSALVVS